MVQGSDPYNNKKVYPNNKHKNINKRCEIIKNYGPKNTFEKYNMNEKYVLKNI